MNHHHHHTQQQQKAGEQQLSEPEDMEMEGKNRDCSSGPNDPPIYRLQ